MKTLLILRHGKSSWKNIGLADHDRPLKKRGKRDAYKIGELIKNEGIIPGVVLSSTAKRARDTAELVFDAIGEDGNIQLHSSLYHGDSEDYKSMISAVEKDCQIIMVVGHNPGLEELLYDLTEVNEWMPTACLAQVEFMIDSWNELVKSSDGKLVNFWLPRGL
jgi:phosphohistidine phosphatase